MKPQYGEKIYRQAYEKMRHTMKQTQSKTLEFILWFNTRSNERQIIYEYHKEKHY